jgi:ketosteroid isomerase-like protein
MKRGCMWLVLAVLALGGIARAQSGGTEKAVAALEQQWLKGQQTNNFELIAPLLADKIVVTDSEGKVQHKEDAAAFYKKTKFDSAEYSDVKVTVFGKTAIATGVFKGTGTDADGKHFDSNERWTDTWVEMPGGKWQCVASHTSAIKM